MKSFSVKKAADIEQVFGNVIEFPPSHPKDKIIQLPTSKSEFPEIFPPDLARQVANEKPEAEVRLWLLRAAEEVERLYEQTEKLIIMTHELECEKAALEAWERLRVFKETRKVSLKKAVPTSDEELDEIARLLVLTGDGDKFPRSVVESLYRRVRQSPAD